jgi:hypothetical protein
MELPGYTVILCSTSENLPPVFHRGYSILHSHQQLLGLWILHILADACYFLHLSGVRWCLIVVLIYSFIGHHFVYLLAILQRNVCSTLLPVFYLVFFIIEF